jgi:hypothetical protein
MIKIRPDVIKIKDPESGNYTSLLAIKGEKGDRGENGNVFAYPVGAIYMSVDPTSPASLFGGNWESLKNRFLLGAGDTYDAEDEDGSETHKHDAGNLVAEISTHPNGLSGMGDEGVNAFLSLKKVTREYQGYRNVLIFSNAGVNNAVKEYSGNVVSPTYATQVSGETAESNNMPPYLAVYMWKRIA